MARPDKEGLEYFPLDVNVDLDDKLQMIIGEFGLNGEFVFIKLISWIYNHLGYYCVWDEETQLKFSTRYSYALGSGQVVAINNIVLKCVRWSLFEKQVFQDKNILTSKRIQATWWEASRKRKVRKIRPDIDLISSEIRLTPEETSKKAEKTSKKAEETIESKVKENKENESNSLAKENCGIVTCNAEETVLNDSILFEHILAKTGKTEESAKQSLHKYHLYLEEKEQYPKGKKAVFAGFEKWLLNESNFNGNYRELSALNHLQQKGQEFLKPITSHREETGKSIIDQVYGKQNG